MEVRGFKSFYEKTEVVFPEQITSIVGPNGCGKSNLSDAIHWVLGEQRVRVLRGESMQDVIFNGAENRKPLGMAEVTLVLRRDPSKPVLTGPELPLLDHEAPPEKLEEPDPATGEPAAEIEPEDPTSSDVSAETMAEAAGGNGQPARAAAGEPEPSAPSRVEAPVPSGIEAGNGSGDSLLEHRWPERITVTRRLFRSGESEYRLDGARCRLRDVQDLLRRVAIGSGVSTIIEQGKIAQMVSSRPKERRILIEEAAGIAGFKVKKREATLKLEATEANLVRLEDIISEVRRQINSLKRQASKARRYQRLMEQRRRLARIHLTHRQREIDSRLGTLRGEAAAFQDREAGARLLLSGPPAVPAQALRTRGHRPGTGLLRRRREPAHSDARCRALLSSDERALAGANRSDGWPFQG